MKGEKKPRDRSKQKKKKHHLRTFQKQFELKGDLTVQEDEERSGGSEQGSKRKPDLHNLKGKGPKTVDASNLSFLFNGPISRSPKKRGSKRGEKERSRRADEHRNRDLAKKKKTSTGRSSPKPAQTGSRKRKEEEKDKKKGLGEKKPPER